MQCATSAQRPRDGFGPSLPPDSPIFHSSRFLLVMGLFMMSCYHYTTPAYGARAGHRSLHLGLSPYVTFTPSRIMCETCSVLPRSRQLHHKNEEKKLYLPIAGCPYLTSNLCKDGSGYGSLRQISSAKTTVVGNHQIRHNPTRFD